MSENSLTDLTHFEVVALLAALGKHVKICERAIAYNDKRGWKPEPGRKDINKLRLASLHSLLRRVRATPHGQALAREQRNVEVSD